MTPRKIVPLPVREPAGPATVGAGGAAAAPAAAPAPHVTYHGGPVIGSVEVTTIFWGVFWTQAAGIQLAGQLNGFFDFVLNSIFMDMLLLAGTPLAQAEDQNGDFLLADFDTDGIPDLWRGTGRRDSVGISSRAERLRFGLPVHSVNSTFKSRTRSEACTFLKASRALQ